jgi:hypothetical protein
MQRAQRRQQLTAALLAAVAAAASDWAYLAVIHGQDTVPPLPAIVPFVSGYIGAIAVAAVIGLACVLAGRMPAAKTLFLAAAAGSAALGFIAILSIGVALFITAALLSVAAQSIPPVQRPNFWLWPMSGAILAIVGLIAGFVLVGTF